MDLELWELSPFLEERLITAFEWSWDDRFLVVNEGWSTLTLVNFDDGSETELISGASESITKFVWSPIDYQIATSVWQDEQSVLYLIKALSGEKQILLESELNHQILPLSWSPDGEWLAFSIEAPGKIGLYIIHLESGQYFPILEKSITVDLVKIAHPSGIRFWKTMWLGR